MANEGQSIAVNDKSHRKLLAYLRRNNRNVTQNIAIAELAYRTGARVGSIAQLELDDVLDVDGELLEIVVLRKATVKGKSTTRIFLTHEKVREALMAWVQERPSIDGVNNLFVTQKGTAYSPKTLSALFEKHFEKAKLHGTSFHGYRRGFASNVMAQKNSNIVMLKTLMNHRNINTTARYVETMDNVLMDIVKEAN